MHIWIVSITILTIIILLFFISKFINQKPEYEENHFIEIGYFDPVAEKNRKTGILILKSYKFDNRNKALKDVTVNGISII